MQAAGSVSARCVVGCLIGVVAAWCLVEWACLRPEQVCVCAGGVGPARSRHVASAPKVVAGIIDSQIAMPLVIVGWRGWEGGLNAGVGVRCRPHIQTLVRVGRPLVRAALSFALLGRSRRGRRLPAAPLSGHQCCGWPFDRFTPRCILGRGSQSARCIVWSSLKCQCRDARHWPTATRTFVPRCLSVAGRPRRLGCQAPTLQR